MNIFRLNFSQKIWLGFGIIILLLSVSSAISLYNLFDINDSTTQVNESAVPVLKQSNQSQISLLKQAKLSAFGFNAESPIEVEQVSQDFIRGAAQFNEDYQQLKSTVSQSAKMLELVDKADVEYQVYKVAVEQMFKSKTETLKAGTDAKAEVDILSNLVDDAGAFLLDIVWTDYADDEKSREMMEGIQGRLDGLIFGLFNLADEISRSSDLDYLEEATRAVEDGVRGVQIRNDHALTSLPDLAGRESWEAYKEKLVEFQERATGEQGIIALKIKQIEQAAMAREKLNESETAVRKVTAIFDQLLVEADELFNTKQAGVLDTVAIGTKITIIGWIILMLMASQNFNSMRKSIKKKMADLAKLNSTGEVLSSLMDKNKALEEVMAAMHDQVGVAQGSVYLMNDEDKLEVKAFYPPKNIDPSRKPAQFTIGEGIIGRAAEKKDAIFIRNTAQDSDFVKSSDSEAKPKALLCIPLLDKDVLIGAMNFSGEVKSVSFEDSDYEFASSIARMLVTTIKNIRMRETIEEQNRTLEHKVKERTAELHKKNKDIAIMMANMQQGLFTIVEGGVIHPEYSTYLESILGTKKIANHNFIDLIFKSANVGSDQVNQIATAVDAMIGEDEMMWDFNSHILIDEAIISPPDGADKIVEFDWVPILNIDTDEIDKIMVTLRDVTQLRALQNEAEAQKRELAIIGQILNVAPVKFNQFIASAKQFINECQELIASTEEKDLAVVATLFRNMHTIKGNARTHGFKQINDIVHEVETTYDELRKSEDELWDKEALLAELSEAEQAIDEYHNIARQKLGSLTADAGQGVSVDTKKVRKLIDDALTIDTDATNSGKTWIKDAYSVLVATQGKALSEMIEPVIDSAAQLATELDKPAPQVVVDDDDLAFENDTQELLNNIFMHVLRNSLDHGIESAEERVKKGKAEAGRIDIQVNRQADRVIMEVEDDGRGLAVDKLYQKALDSGVYKAEDAKPSATAIANLIFDSGFSTAEKVTEISGRGVGMDAVKQFLADRNGDIEIVLKDESEKGFHHFLTRISLSSEVCLPQLKA